MMRNNHNNFSISVRSDRTVELVTSIQVSWEAKELFVTLFYCYSHMEISVYTNQIGPLQMLGSLWSYWVIRVKVLMLE